MKRRKARTSEVKYNYTPELQDVLKQIKSVKKTLTFRNMPANPIEPAHAPTLRAAYLESLRTDLTLLHSALDRWYFKGAQMEVPADNSETGDDT